MNPNELGRKVSRLLNIGLTRLDQRTLDQLEAARETALARHRASQPVAELAGAHGNANHHGGSRWLPQRLLLWLPLVAALLTVSAIGYWHDHQQNSEDIDAALLSGDLPLRAYVDKDFEEWLSGSSH